MCGTGAFFLEVMMKLLEPFRLLTRFEWILWIASLTAVMLSFILSGSGDVLNLIASLLGATALIFVSKGHVLGQVLTVVFAVFYGIISYHFTYYGEMITYLGMTAPMAFMAIISWLRHPYKDSSEVEVSTVSKAQLIIMTISALLVTAAFYFILKAFNTANLIWSTVSVTTSFIASYLTFLRSPFYGLGYAVNDVILIILWVSASMQDTSYIPMVACFVIFFVNDIYGFYNWQRIKRRQERQDTVS